MLTRRSLLAAFAALPARLKLSKVAEAEPLPVAPQKFPPMNPLTEGGQAIRDTIYFEETEPAILGIAMKSARKGETCRLLIGGQYPPTTMSHQSLVDVTLEHDAAMGDFLAISAESPTTARRPARSTLASRDSYFYQQGVVLFRE